MSDYTRIPDELKQLPQWVCADSDKAPINPKNGNYASVTNPTTWGTFDEVVEAGSEIGRVFTKDDPYVGIDLDPKTPEQEERCRKIVEAFDSYTETSRSGKGFHIIVKGEIPHALKRDNVEVYDEKRYFIFTGKAINDHGINDRQELLDTLVKEMSGGTVTRGEYADLKEEASGLTDEQVEARVTQSSKFKDLWGGRWDTHYPSQSEADFVLLWLLSVVTCSNEQACRLFRKSGLGQRKKAQRDDYLSRMLKRFRAEQLEINNVGYSESFKNSLFWNTPPDGVKPNFERVLAQTLDLAGLDKVDRTAAAAELVETASHLSPVEKDMIHKEIKKHTSIPLKTLQDQEKAGREDQEPEPDDRTLALQLVNDIGCNNILAAKSFVWQWKGTGVWETLEDLAIKQRVQRFIAGRIESVGKYRVDSVKDLFTSEVFRPDQQFNIGPPECVNVLNGELVLEGDEWRLHPHVREHYRTSQIPVEWDPQAEAPRFIRFLQEVFHGDLDAGEKAWALLEMMGYTLMTHCRHERFIMLVGGGANGKSVLLYVLEQLCGLDNVVGVQPSQFGSSFHRAHLHGKLANIVSELRQGEVIDDEALKGITSGELTTVDHKYKDPFDMRPHSTCWFGTNHMPHTRDFSDALFRRALVVPFNRQFKPELNNCDPALKEKLVGELPGILWMVLNAYKRALVHGFTTPASCAEAREKWRLEADQVAQFVGDCCVVDLNSSEPAGHLYVRYKVWADSCGINKKVGLVTFRHRLTVLNFGKKVTTNANLVTGLRLKPE